MTAFSRHLFGVEFSRFDGESSIPSAKVGKLSGQIQRAYLGNQVSYEENKICSKENQKVNKENWGSKAGIYYPGILDYHR